MAILNAAIDGAKKTYIVNNANLNFDIVNKYLEILQNKGLIEKEGNMYLTTDKGKSYQELAKQLKL